MMQRISKADLAARLDAAIGFSAGLNGLNTLLYGWKVFRRYGPRYLDALKHRDWLYITEVMDFSAYVGYDLAFGNRVAKADASSVIKATDASASPQKSADFRGPQIRRKC